MTSAADIRAALARTYPPPEYALSYEVGDATGDPFDIDVFEVVA